jgi:enoyl-CoA hydratase/carnithine racemase
MRETFDAAEAYRIGLVNKVVPLDELLPIAWEWAERICTHGPLAVRAAKEAMIKGASLPLEEGLRLEWELEERLLITEDAQEGENAFVEKRKPVYKGR